MGRRRQGGLDQIAAMPWPVGVVLGIVAYLAIRYGIGMYFSTAGGSLLKGLGAQASGGSFAPLAWMALGLCWIGAAASFFKGRHRKQLLDTQNGLASIAALSWREFEMLVGEAFRRQGYAVEETGLGGADGGIDLILRKEGRTELVQCKQWHSRQVTPAVVREMWGLVDHHRADGVKIVGIGDFTRDAAAFAQGKSIELINGERLIAMVREMQSTGVALSKPRRIEPAVTSPASEGNPDCPRCGSEMARRTNRSNGQLFWGCSAFPRCTATRVI
jgi:restriction system protein